MRTEYQVWSAIAVVTFAIVAAVDLSGGRSEPTSSATRSASAAAQQPYTAPYTAPSASSDTAGAYTGSPSTSVVRVVDGDTFELSDGSSVRVLGIDSCETGTPGGASASADAEGFLSAGQITLSREPGVDTDPYGRLLRYVSSTTGGDMGEHMVRASHTEVYSGANDASPSRVSTLRSLDDGARVCGAAQTTEPSPEPDDESHRRPYVPYVPDPVPDEDSGSSRRHTGNTGHPCLPGERDGDDDGYCGEGRR